MGVRLIRTGGHSTEYFRLVDGTSLRGLLDSPKIKEIEVAWFCESDGFVDVGHTGREDLMTCVVSNLFGQVCLAQANYSLVPPPDLSLPRFCLLYVRIHSQTPRPPFSTWNSMMS